MAFTPLSIFSEFLEQAGGAGRSNNSQAASWWYDLELHLCRRLSLGGDPPSSNPCSWLCEQKPLDLRQECVAVNVYWIKELCQTDIFFFLDALFIPGTTKLNQSQTGLIFAPGGRLAVSAGICSCHGLKVWLSRGQGIS